MAELLTAVQETILAVAGRNAGRYSRSGLAKLLVGATSWAADLADDPNFGRLAGRGRKEITFEIDILLQQGFLGLDFNQHVIPGSSFPGALPTDPQAGTTGDA